MVPQTVPGKKLGSLKEHRFPAKGETELMKIERLEKSYKKLYGKLQADLSVMHRPSKEIDELLYEGVSKEDEGRKAYMRKRKQVTPDEKYKYPITTSFDYGWDVMKIMRQYGLPKHGKKSDGTDSFWRDNSIFNPSEDPNALTSAM